MRYLTKYKLFESNSNINWSIIDEAKERSLDLLDDGFELIYSVGKILNDDVFTIISGKYSHTVDHNRKVDNSISNVVYCFYYLKGGEVDLESSKELVDILSDIYPDDKITYDRFFNFGPVQALKKHLLDNYHIEESELYNIGLQNYKYYDVANIFTVYPGESDEMEFISCNERTAFKLAKEYFSGLSEENSIDIKLYFRFECVDIDKLKKELIFHEEEEDSEYSEQDLMEELKYYSDEDALNIVKECLHYDWLDSLTRGIIDIDGYGTTLSSYDGAENFEYHNDTKYYIFRIS